MLDPKIYHFIISPEGVICVNNWGHSYVYTKAVEIGLREFMDSDLKKLNDICNIMKLPVPQEESGFGYLSTSIKTLNMHGAFNVGELINDEMIKINYVGYNKEYV